MSKRAVPRRGKVVKPQVVVVRAPAKRQMRKPVNKYSGLGAYKSEKEALVRDQPSIGQKIGQSIGGGLGLGVEQFIRWMTGMGDYQVKSNVLLAPNPPKMINESNKGGTLIRHREFLTDITTSATIGAFKNTSYPLNPGLDTTFPWLSQVAANYEQYSLEGVIFEFRSMSADALNSTNTALGSVIMATQYDSIVADFTNKSEMENHEFGNSCKPSVDMMHPIECAPRQTTLTELYVRAGANPDTSDIRLYDWGKFQIATTGFQAASVNIGELWVTYQVRLLKPRLFASLGAFNAVADYSAASFTNLLPLGSGLTNNYDTVGLSFNYTTQVVTFPNYSFPQTYLVRIHWVGSAAAITGPVLTLSSNLVAANLITSSASGQVQAPANTQTASVVMIAACYKSVPGSATAPTLTFGAAGTLPSSGTGVRLTVCQIDNSSCDAI